MQGILLSYYVAPQPEEADESRIASIAAVALGLSVDSLTIRAKPAVGALRRSATFFWYAHSKKN